jgi:hypothetical protein
MMPSMRSVVAVVLVLAFGASGAVGAAEPAKYPAMAPVEAYRIKSPAEEVALARSAAAPAISADAEVMVLGARGYETAAKGKNGWVCLVLRSWEATFDDPEFWNPKVRSPNCFNPVAARTELPKTLKRTEWALAGASKEQIVEKTRAAISAGAFKDPEPGAFSFMLSKHGYITDRIAGPWLPHMMFYVPHGQAAAWGANQEGSPVVGQDGSELESTVLFVPVRKWSDGSPAVAKGEQHQHTH